MLATDLAVVVRTIESEDDFAETRLEAIGFIFHGVIPEPGKKGKGRGRATSNLLHFARCTKLERTPATEDRLWFRSVRVASAHLDEHVGEGRWSWCKNCQREVTKKVLNEL